MKKNKALTLASRPHGNLSESNIKQVELTFDETSQQGVVVENLYLSIDPTQRIWMSDRDQYMPPLEIGEVIRAFGIGKVISSSSEQYRPGDFVSGLLGWQEFSIHQPQQLIKLAAPAGVPLTAFLSVLGLTGLTAYFGYYNVLQPARTGTFVVSGAAGAVGSIVGQIGKIEGQKVIGIAGKKNKLDWLREELHFDHVLNYNDADLRQQLARACPNGIDYYFDNVGGSISDTVMPLMSLGGRVALCGLISTYNSETEQGICRSYGQILMRRLTVQGFIVSDYQAQAPEAVGKLLNWVKADKIKYKEHIVVGLEKAPLALAMLFDGRNEGKLIVQVKPD
jgi:NADPH-dependent curcumin reductase CurA